MGRQQVRFPRSRPCAAGGLLLVVSLTAGCPELLDFLGLRHASDDSRIALELVADGLTAPLGMAIPPGDSSRIFVVDQIGKVRIIDAEGNLLDTPFLDLTDRLVELGIDLGGGVVFDERGLLSLAFHPDYSDNGRFFVFYSAPKEAGDPDEFNCRSRLSEFNVSDSDPNLADPDSEQVLLEILKPQFNHNGGQLAFGPDGMLYVSTGDGGGANDADEGHTPDMGNGQDKTKLLGKLLRLDVDTPGSYSVPADNPFVGDGGVAEEIWAFGFRNPWRFAFDIGGEHRLFLADVGQDLFEEINIATKGGNYGWRIREGAHCFDPTNPATSPDDCAATGAGGEALIDPIIEQPRDLGIAIIGGFVYRGNEMSALMENYVFAQWSTDFGEADGALFAATEDAEGNWTTRELSIAGESDGRIHRFILGLGQDADGELYVLSTENIGPFGETGSVHKIVAAP
ncbi:MAG TPA: PQQ-dependent sugar dehydrogenase [Phycisphaerae bacterium]|nr:PQQ-dependent sugar dehydrogenase [Phycisphaerae bacterium]